MAWTIKVEEEAKKDLDKLDRQVAWRILAFLRQRLAALDDPRLLGESLTGSRLGELWKYRIGDYRVIARLEDSCLVVVVVTIGHRSKVYRKP